MLAVQGDLEDEEKDAFRDAVLGSNTSNDSGASDIALDLSGVTYLSEMALAVLIQVLKVQQCRGQKLRLLRASRPVRKKLERTALSPFFPIEE